MFSPTSIVKNSEKEKWVYGGYGIAFEVKCKRNFSNDYDKNVIIFAVDNRSSSHFDNHKNNFLVLSERDTFGINGSFRKSKKKY